MKASCSMFSQLLKLIPRTEFEALVKKHKAEYAAKGLSSWAQFVAMLFCQLGRAQITGSEEAARIAKSATNQQP